MTRPDRPPVAPQVPFVHTEHGVERPDPWHWMREDSPELTAYLAEERRWYDGACAHLDSLISTLETEMASRVPQADRSAAWSRQRFSYYTCHETGSDYASIWREIRNDLAPKAAGSAAMPDLRNENDGKAGPNAELVLDVPALATDSGYLDLGLTIVSPSEDLLAYSVDTTGDEVFTLRFRDLRSGIDLDEEVPRSYYSGAWSADSSCFFYTVHDELYRPCEVRRHRIGTPATEDAVVLTEPDERYELSVRLSRSQQAVLIRSESRDTSEIWHVDARSPESRPASVGGRRRGVVYHAEHVRDGDLLLVTDDDAVEFRMAAAPVPGEDQDHTAWREMRPEDPAERLERVDAFAQHAVLSLRTGGQHVLRVVPLDDLAAGGRLVRSRFPGGSVHLARTPSYDAGVVRLVDEAHVEPPVWSDLALADGSTTDRHRQAAPAHDPSRYVTEVRTFPAPDGTPVSATLVRHRDTALDGSAPCLLYGYGAYEYTFEPEWEPPLVSLLDRGVVYAHAHVRGGGEGGRRWWLDGRMAHKHHTFSDFIAVADGLADGLVDGRRIVSRGLSAGGLLQGAVFSQRPDRWAGVVAEVPFVDVVTTMFDATTPLTVGEWDEWGDPRVREQFEWMMAYSPYDNPPPAGSRPPLLVTGAVHDPRVMVREPAKWVARLRDTDPEWSPRCLFRCELGAGAHSGPSGRYGHLAYEAEVAAWILDTLGLS